MRVVERRALVWLAAAAVAAGACSQAQTNAQTSQPSPSSSTRSATRSAAGEAITLEFDVPAEFAQPAGSASAVTGFRVGFFRGSNTAAVRTLEFSRDALLVRERTVRVTIPRDQIPECAADCAIRVQTLSRAQVSVWSDPVPLGGAAPRQAQPASPERPQSPQQPRVARTDRPRDTSPRERQTGLAPGDIDKYALLSQSLRELLPADVKLETELTRFRRIEDVALAVVISRDYDIPFTTVSTTFAGPPRVAPRDVLTRLRPDVDARDAIRKSRAEVRKLLAMEENRGLR